MYTYSFRGSVLVEFLLTLLIISILIPIGMLSISVIFSLDNFDEEIQDQIAIQQLRRVLLLSYDVEVTGDALSFVYLQKDCELLVRNHRLIQQPGTVIFLSEIDDVYFVEENEIIYMVYQRSQKIEKIALCHT